MNAEGLLGANRPGLWDPVSTRPPNLDVIDRRTAGGKTTTLTTTAGEHVARAKQHIRKLSVDEVATALDTDTVILVDIREPEEVHREGQIPGAMLAPRGMLEFWADPTSPSHREEFAPPASR